MICDAHVHFGPDTLVEEVIAISDLERYIEKFSVRKLMAFASNAEIDKVNADLIKYSRTHKEIYALMRMTPSNVSWCKQNLPKLLDDKIVGIKYHPSIDKVKVTDPVFSDVFDILHDKGAIALIHTGRWLEMASYEFAIEIAKSYPKLRVVMAHMGGNELQNAKAAIENSKGIDNLWLETSNCRIPSVIRWAVRDLGSKRVLLGSDIPWGTMSANLATVKESLTNETDIQNIIHDNLDKMI
ncbi:amidohydrolase family protein [Nitrososphaera sp.]|uniref:amidohydrolase family protein n=1 Tax=Nitrososphaera sp. TaxID=1971748 RepID=UPI0017F33D57|nr:amidohydrolase family protein [Nitrososphaera sp.]NWG36453.1 amidohydrolase family protein [Nitrososphaera sp.]